MVTNRNFAELRWKKRNIWVMNCILICWIKMVFSFGNDLMPLTKLVHPYPHTCSYIHARNIRLITLHLMLAVPLMLIPISYSKSTIFFNNVTFGFLFCLIKWKNRSDACSNYSVRAHKALFRFLSDDFLKGMLFQLSYDLVSCILCWRSHYCWSRFHALRIQFFSTMSPLDFCFVLSNGKIGVMHVVTIQ